MKILVTGASGFLGKTLCAHLRDAKHEVVPLSSRDADLTQGDSLRPFADASYDQIFHLAAWTQAGDFCLRHPGEQWIINQQINTNVLAWNFKREILANYRTLIERGVEFYFPVNPKDG
jgi:GDP-L-fucose synthase